jgi:hypothetical protein
VRKLSFVLFALIVAVTLSPSSILQAQVTGFGGAAQTGWTSNHTGTGASANVTGVGGVNDVLNITSADNGDNNSYFFNTAQPITTGGWTSTWTYQYTAGSGTPADGITLTLQNDPRGASALGAGGGSLGYSGGFSSSPVNGTNGITSSESIHLNIFTGAGGGPGIGEYVNAGGAPSGGTYSAVTPVVLNSLSNPVNVSLSFDGASTLTETLTQPSSNSSFTKTFSVPSYQQVLGGGNSFFVGFTGATGGLNAAQQISGFSFTPTGAQVGPSLNIFKFNDSVVGINANPGAGTAANSPAAEQAPGSIDSSQPTKYLNFNKLNAGIIVTPAKGATIAKELGLTSANDAPERDPASYEVWGTNDNNLSDISPALNPAGWQTFWTLVSTGPVPAFALRGQEQDFFFSNTNSYSNYMVDFPTIANAATANSMQVADIQLSGSVPEPSSLLLVALGGLGLLLIRARRRV